jgi:hypothetical protein
LSSDAGGLPVDVCISRMTFQCFCMRCVIFRVFVVNSQDDMMSA